MTAHGAERKLAAIMFTDMVGYSARAVLAAAAVVWTQGLHPGAARAGRGG